MRPRQRCSDSGQEGLDNCPDHWFRRILVTTDGSLFGDAALPVAGDLARTYGASLCVVYVIPDPLLKLIGAGPYAYNYSEEDRACHEGGERVLDIAAAQLDGLEVEKLLLDGRARDVADCLAEAVQTQHADVVVMSTHGHGGLLHTLLGSVAERVLRQVQVPVLLVRPVRLPTPKILAGRRPPGGH